MADKTYNIRYSDPKLRGSQSLIRENLPSIRNAKDIARYHSIAAPPRFTHVVERGSGAIVAIYFDGRAIPQGVKVGWAGEKPVGVTNALYQ